MELKFTDKFEGDTHVNHVDDKKNEYGNKTIWAEANLKP